LLDLRTRLLDGLFRAKLKSLFINLRRAYLLDGLFIEIGYLELKGLFVR
jgi:hypothetical protein